MQLLYIYIHSFRNLKDSELCFSPSLDVRYEFDEKRLAFRKNPEVPEFAAKLYEPHIKSVHGIVGRNAVGKTNLADLISMPSALRMQVSSDAYFLLYASDLTENARYYIEICDDNNRLFPSLKTEEGREQWRTGWIRLIDGVPVWDEKQERFRTSVISLRESINSEVYVTEEGENQSQEKYLQVYDNRQRIVGTYTCGSIANQFTSFQFLHKVSHLFADVHNDYQNAPSFDDKEYILSLKVSDKWKE